ncbi:MAG: hypothetical protein K9K79_11265 [Desulfohalobiaceae bacterium]|nr:hypothetical protein [Desulfohalobiaceae bacterium]
MYGENLNVYLCKVRNQENRKGWFLVLAQNLSEIDFAVSSDPDGCTVEKVDLVGVQDSTINNLTTINAKKFKAEAEASEGGYAGIHISDFIQSN